ncbi:MspA family porin [Mycobacterium sp. 155]|uniref:MspA family porin n=1 Tax=Mycobacterium sp. 155 TaxID=1157943 RepID=UPI00036B9600|nr:MspA family porin [Mycobacterium sp. 155]
MMQRLAAVSAAALLVVPVVLAGSAAADPSNDANVVPAANAAPNAPAPGGPAGPVPSGPPGQLMTPDGWQLNVVGLDESMEPVASLTGSPTSREYLVDGTFVGAVTGTGNTELGGGTLEAGYQIGCGIIQDDIESITSGGITPFISSPIHLFPTPSLDSKGIFPAGIAASLNQQIKIDLKPGTVNIVPVGKKSFKGTKPRISITGFRVKIDGCAGQSFIRSYATLTSSTDNTDDVITYLGVTKAV